MAHLGDPVEGLGEEASQLRGFAVHDLDVRPPWQPFLWRCDDRGEHGLTITRNE